MSIDPKAQEIENLCKSVIGAKITLCFTMTLPNGENHSGEIDNCNIIGNCMENILYPVINNSIPTFKKGPSGQKPDFTNSESETKHHEYELKCFNKKSGAGFDIGSITGYIKDISMKGGVQKKLNVKYLIFEYENDYGVIKISNFWMLSIYDICCGYGGKKPINIGGQSGVNIRPATKKQWTCIKSRVKRNPKNFLDRIEELIQSKWYKVDDSEKQNKLYSIREQRQMIGY